MNRRRLIASSAAALTGIALAKTPMLAGQESTGFPELVITLTDEGFSIPPGTTAGRYAVTIENASSTPSHASLGLLADDVDLAMVEADMSSESEDVPQWILDTRWVGLPDWGMPGESRSGIVDLPPGTYLGFSPFAGWFNIIEIGGESITLADPASNVSVQLVEMGFTWGQNAFPSGPQLLEVVNSGATLHDIQFYPVPVGTTIDHVMEMFMLEDTGGTPSPDNPLSSAGEEFVPQAATSILSPGVTTWLDIDLAPGSYLVMCPLPFPSGPPHAFLGMMEIVDVV